MSETLPVASDLQATISLEEKSKQLDAYLQNMQSMSAIGEMMRETPTPKSDDTKQQDKNLIERVEFPVEGGMLTYMEGFDEPYQGFPFGEIVERMDTVKKLTKGFKSGFYHNLWKKFNNSPLKNAMMIVTSPFFKIYYRAEIHACWRYIERHKVKPTMYCRSVRELFRAFSIPVSEKETQKSRELRERIRDILCMHYEFDNAYRYRGQDVIVELNKANLDKDPMKEMMRLFNVMSDREVLQEIKDTWTLTKWMFDYYRYDKEIRDILVSVLKNLNLEECKLNKYDFPYVKPRKDYQFNIKL